MVQLSFGALTAALLPLIARGVAGGPPSGVSAFAAPDNSVAFALNIPNDGSNDLYFSFSASSNVSWAAVGMGSDHMYNTLMFMMYEDMSGHNITLSPRLSYNYVEPSYSPDINVDLLPGTGMTDGQMQANFVCHNCFSWKGGWISQGDANAPFIFASGPRRIFNSDSVTASVPIHTACGIFTMDLTQAWGPAGISGGPITNTSGTTLKAFTTFDHFAGASHASLMAMAMLIIMPSGMLFMRIFQKRVWHTVCQTLATTMVLLGLFAGIYCSLLYNRTNKYATAHQILGIVLVIGVFAQFGIGFKLFRLYSWGLDTKKLLPIHICLGLIVVLGGILDIFLGLRLSFRESDSWRYIAVLGVVLASYVVVKFFLCVRARIAPPATEREDNDHLWNLRVSQPPVYLADYRPSVRAQRH